MKTVLSNAEFNKAVKAHLAEYKRTRLEVMEDGVWGRNQSPYPHILPKDRFRLNIIERFRDDFWQDYEAGRLGSRFNLQSDFHHLNSSQALAFNLFYPFIRHDQRYMPELLALLGVPVKPVAQVAFEKILDRREATNFDFCVGHEDGSYVTVEVKYSENGFAGHKHGPRYDKRWDQIYRNRAAAVFVPSAATKDQFLEHYQLFRNLVYLDTHPESHVLFIVPTENGAFRDLNVQLDNVLRPEYRDRAVIVGLETLVDLLLVGAVDIGSKSLARDVKEFRRKYLEYQ